MLTNVLDMALDWDEIIEDLVDMLCLEGLLRVFGRIFRERFLRFFPFDLIDFSVCLEVMVPCDPVCEKGLSKSLS